MAKEILFKKDLRQMNINHQKAHQSFRIIIVSSVFGMRLRRRRPLWWGAGRSIAVGDAFCCCCFVVVVVVVLVVVVVVVGISTKRARGFALCQDERFNQRLGEPNRVMWLNAYKHTQRYTAVQYSGRGGGGTEIQKYYSLKLLEICSSWRCETWPRYYGRKEDHRKWRKHSSLVGPHRIVRM